MIKNPLTRSKECQTFLSNCLILERDNHHFIHFDLERLVKWDVWAIDSYLDASHTKILIQTTVSSCGVSSPAEVRPRTFLTKISRGLFGLAYQLEDDGTYFDRFGASSARCSYGQSLYLLHNKDKSLNGSEAPNKSTFFCENVKHAVDFWIWRTDKTSRRSKQLSRFSGFHATPRFTLQWKVCSVLAIGLTYAPLKCALNN